MNASSPMRGLRIALAALAGVVLLGVYGVLYTAFAIGDQITLYTGTCLMLGALLCIGAFVASFRSTAYCILLYAIALVPVRLLGRADLAFQKQRELRSVQARRDIRADDLRSPVRLICPNGDIAVLTHGDGGYNIMLVPKNPQVLPESLAWDNTNPNAPAPLPIGLDHYLEAHADCTSPQYPSLHALFGHLEDLYRQGHPSAQGPPANDGPARSKRPAGSR